MGQQRCTTTVVMCSWNLTQGSGLWAEYHERMTMVVVQLPPHMLKGTGKCWWCVVAGA